MISEGGYQSRLREHETTEQCVSDLRVFFEERLDLIAKHDYLTNYRDRINTIG